MEMNIKKVAPTLVKSFANWFEIDFSVKLFGVQVFKFHYPPQGDVVTDLNNSNNNV